MTFLGLYNQRVGGAPSRTPWKYDGWARGQNSFAEDNEIRPDEFSEGINCEIIGKSSISLPRRGCQTFATKTGATNFNGWGIYKDPKTSVNLLVTMWDGHLYSINTAGTVTEIDGTKTWDTAAKMRGIQVREWFYFGNDDDYLAKTDGSVVTRWALVTAPVGLGLSHSTGAGTDYLYAYVVTAITGSGETDSSTEQSINAGLLKDTAEEITLSWTKKADASVTGYNVYKAVNGTTLTLVTFIPQISGAGPVTFIDDGVLTQSLVHEAPTYNSTGGVKGNIYGRYADTIFISGNSTEPDIVFYGGTGTNWENFSAAYNGGWIKVGRGDGERVTSMIGFEDFMFIFKENSIWKFIFASDGGPQLIAVIPQYGTNSPDSVWRFEKDIMFFGTDGRFRIVGYEPSQLNVIRTTDISNRIQPDLDALDKSAMDNFFGVTFDQKYILCNQENAYAYDRRYIGFCGTWTNYNYDRFITWDKGTGTKLLFGAETGTGKIKQLLVDNTYDDDGTNISASFSPKRIDGGDDTYVKWYEYYKIKVKNPRGLIDISTFKDGENLIDSVSIDFDIGGGIDELMWDEMMWDEGVSITTVADQIQIITKELYAEAYSIYPKISLFGNATNHVILQTMNGLYQTEDPDYLRDDRRI
jgi:hypothetical protein